MFKSNTLDVSNIKENYIWGELTSLHLRLWQSVIALLMKRSSIMIMTEYYTVEKEIDLDFVGDVDKASMMMMR